MLATLGDPKTGCCSNFRKSNKPGRARRPFATEEEHGRSERGKKKESGPVLGGGKSMAMGGQTKGVPERSVPGNSKGIKKTKQRKGKYRDP